METKTNINSLESKLNTRKKPLAKAIEDISNLSNCYKNKVESLISNIDLSNQDWYNIEMALAEEFHLPNNKKEELWEDFKRPMTLAWVMNHAESFWGHSQTA